MEHNMPISINLLKVAHLPWKKVNLAARYWAEESTHYLAVKDKWVFWSEKHVKQRPLWFKDRVEYEFSVKHGDILLIEDTGESAADIFEVVDEVVRLRGDLSRTDLAEQLERMLN